MKKHRLTKKCWCKPRVISFKKSGMDKGRRVPDDKKYGDCIDYFGISASEVLHEIKRRYKAIDYFNSTHDPFFTSPTWMIEKVMIILWESREKGK